MEENTSVSRLIGEMLERQMRLSAQYWRAFDHWKSNRPLAALGAAKRLSREEVHERRYQDLQILNPFEHAPSDFGL